MTHERDRDTPDPSGDVVPLRRRQAACPICSKPEHARHRPFCSKRCADIDLGRWLKGNYRVPTEEPADPGDTHDTGQEEEEP